MRLADRNSSLGCVLGKSNRGHNETRPILAKQDVLVLFVIALPFRHYLFAVSIQSPFSINTDEITIRDVMREKIAQISQLNPLGPSSYLGFPELVHIVFGWIA